MNDDSLDKNKILDLLVAFAFIDDVLHPQEIRALEKVCDDLGIPEDVLDEIIGHYESQREHTSYEDLCYQALEDFGDAPYKQELAGLVCYIATSDDFHHEKECIHSRTALTWCAS